MKHIELFKEGFDSTIDEKIQPENYPYVGRDAISGEIVYTLVPELDTVNYFYIESLEDNNIITLDSTTWAGYVDNKSKLEYSNDTTSWNSMNGVDSITINNRERLYMRCIEGNICKDANSTPEEDAWKPLFNTSATCNIGGNINTVMFNYTYKDEDCVLPTGAFTALFTGIDMTTDAPTNYIVDASKLVLPGTELSEGCYYLMFYGCTLLTAAPSLPTTKLAVACYNGMFDSCTSLTTAPNLPAIELSWYCYSGMFYNCTSLTVAPELPATVLVDYCYDCMFGGCTSLTVAPVLPATTLAYGCYEYMFEGCTNLNHIKCLATDISVIDCTLDWVNEVAPTGTFIMHPDTNGWEIDSVDGVPIGWTCEFINTNAFKSVKFVAEEANSTIGLESLSTNQKLYYRTINTKWIEMDTSTTITLTNINDEVYIRGILSANNTSSDYTQFKMSGKIAAYGNCNAIWNYQDLNASLKKYCGTYMFTNCTSLTTAPELPATILTDYCYFAMFNGCTSLTTAPELPATTLTDSCYFTMFSGCASLTTAPELPGTTLAYSCYYSMFSNCTSLTTAPEVLPAITLARNCYKYMFSDCISLTTSPKLPATELGDFCYEYMFNNCTSLVTVPDVLPAITLVKMCYCGMFSNCISLTTAPELPAMTLADDCYSAMFAGCTSLTAAPELSATTRADYCYNGMFYGCTSLNYIKCLITNTNNCTVDWVVNVYPTGTFVKHPNMNNWDRGNHGIPEGWRVVDAEL